jgi:hypothetical protein
MKIFSEVCYGRNYLEAGCLLSSPSPLSEAIVGMQSAHIGKRNSKKDQGLF